MSLKWQSYDVLFLRYGVRQTIFHFGPFIFGPFYPTKNLKNKIFSKTEKKNTRSVIILDLCTTNDNHMMYGSWYMEHDTEFFVMADYFLHFHHPNNPWKSKFWNNEKNSMRYIILHMCNINENHRTYGSWDMEPNRHYTLSI